jgi:hypothetical protein
MSQSGVVGLMGSPERFESPSRFHHAPPMLSSRLSRSFAVFFALFSFGPVFACDQFGLSGVSSSGRVDLPFSASASVSGATGSITVTIPDGELPPGLGMSKGGAFSGTPTQIGTWSGALFAYDQDGCEAHATYSITITGNNPCANVSYTVWGGGGTSDVGTPYWASISADGGTAPDGVAHIRTRVEWSARRAQ